MIPFFQKEIYLWVLKQSYVLFLVFLSVLVLLFQFVAFCPETASGSGFDVAGWGSV